MWERLQQSWLGRLHLSLAESVLKRMLRPFLVRNLLHNAGLDRSAQLIAGSAVSSSALLHAYRQLRIEVHNAC